MKRFLVPAAFAMTIMLLGACVEEPPRRPSKKPGSSLPPLSSQTTVDPNLPPEEQGPPTTAVTNPATAPETKPPPPVPAQPPAKVGEIPYAKPVPGKPGFVFSPYDQYKGYIDVRGFPPGTEVKDPYSQKSFLVP
jgi:hypothetical protein